MNEEPKSNRDIEIDLLKSYSHAIIHMRQQYNYGDSPNKFGLVLGAGVSQPFGIPKWNDLVVNIANEINGSHLIHYYNEILTTKVEILYHCYYENEYTNLLLSNPNLDQYNIDLIIKGKWYQIIRKVIYQDFKLINHPYLEDYAEIIKKTPVTVNYNFDSCIEMMLWELGKSFEPERPYETVFNGTVPFRLNKGVIYHPNGYLPKNELDVFSDNIVFSEVEFGQQLSDSIMGQYSSLVHHFSKTTCFFLGISLKDENLKMMLRQCSNHNPGHYHYYCKYTGEDKLTKEQREVFFNYHFNTHNLITLFLNEEQISALGRIIRYSKEKFFSLSRDAAINPVKVYYVTGMPGIGKTSIVRHMQSLSVCNEWVGEPLHLLSRPHQSLTEEERDEVDEWIVQQFAEKNKFLCKQTEGVFLVDRAPLDPLSYCDKDNMYQKAQWYRNKMRQGNKDAFIRSGKIIYLTGEPNEVSYRLYRRKGRENDLELSDLDMKLRNIYDSYAAYIPNINIGFNDFVKKVAREIYCSDYSEIDLSQRLYDLCKYESQHVTLWKRNNLFALSWEKYKNKIDLLYEQIAQSRFFPDVIVGIARGGLLPAVNLSHFFDKGEISVLSIKRNKTSNFYSDRKAPNIQWIKLTSDISNKNVLLIDDIVGSGETMYLAEKRLLKFSPKALVTASLILNINSKYTPTYYTTKVNDWVIFPWETMDNKSNNKELRTLTQRDGSYVLKK